MTNEELHVTITTPEFTAGVVVYEGGCVRAAPKLRWALGYSQAALSAELKARGWPAKARRVPLGGLVSLGGEDDD